MLSILHNNCDRVKIGCLAQLVNVIAPIMTENGGDAWKQTIYYPYMYASLYGNGEALDAITVSDSYKSKEGWDVPYLCASVIDNKQRDEVIVFATNRSLDSDMELDIDLEGYSLVKHIELYNDDLNATNEKTCENVFPTERNIDTGAPISLKKHSWNMLTFKK